MTEESSERDVLLLILMAVAVLLPVGFFFALIGWGGYGIMAYMPMMNYGMHFITFLIPLLFTVILLIGAYYVFRTFSWTQERGRALNIIKERYARGEITEEQYRRMKEELE